MTKLKNTKKGMAKKALSISLVAAMLATSNVPVWAAEFTDGTDAVVEAPVVEEAVDTFSAEAEAPVEEETNTDIELRAEDSTYAVEFKDLPTEIEWNNTDTVKIKVTDTSNKNENITSKLYYTFVIDGAVPSSLNPTTVGTVTDGYASITIPTTVASAANVGKNIQVRIQEDATKEGKGWYKDSANILVAKQTVSAYIDLTTTKVGKDDAVYYTGKTITSVPKNVKPDVTGVKYTYKGTQYDYSAMTPGGSTPDLSLSTFVIEGEDLINAYEVSEKKVTGTADIQSKYYDGKFVVDFSIWRKPVTTENFAENIKVELPKTTYQYTGPNTNPKLSVKCKDVVVTDLNAGKVVEDALGFDTDSFTMAGSLGEQSVGLKINKTKGSLANYDFASGADTTTVKYNVVKRDLADTANTEIKINPVAVAYLTDSKVSVDGLKSNLEIKDADGTDITNTIKNEVTIDLGSEGNLPVKVGETYTVTVKPANGNNVTGSRQVSFTVVARDLNGATFTPATGKDSVNLTSAETYTGKQITKGLTNLTKENFASVVGTLKNGNEDLLPEINFSTTLEFGENVNAGKGKIIINGLGDYAGSKKVFEFTINQRTATDVEVPEKILYNAQNQEAVDYAVVPTVVAKYKEDGKDVKITVPTSDYEVKSEFVEKDGETYKVVTGDEANKPGNYVRTTITKKDGVKGNFSFTTLSNVTAIVNKAITDSDIHMNKTTYTYTGKEVLLDYKVVVGGVELEKGVDFDEVITNGTNVGEGILTLQGKGDYDNTFATAKFNIVAAKTTDVKVAVRKEAPIVYDGTKQKPTKDQLDITLNGVPVEGDFVITYPTTKTANINAGKGQITLTPVKGNKNFEGSSEFDFEITPCKLFKNAGTLKAYNSRNEEVTISNQTFKYDGTAKTFAKTTYSNTVSAPMKFTADDYEIRYVDNVTGNETSDGGYTANAHILVVAKGNYKADGTYTCADGSKIENVVIDNSYKISRLVFDRSDITVNNGAYKGGFDVDPEVTVSYKGKVLTKDKDYELKFIPETADRKNVTNGKTLSVEIIGKGGYRREGNTTFSWGIDKFDFANANILVSGTDAEPVIKVMNGNILVDEKEYTLEAKDGKVTVTATKDNKNYTGTQTVDIKTELEKPEMPVISGVEVVGNKATVILEGECEGATGYDFVISTNGQSSDKNRLVNKNVLTTETTFQYLQQGMYWAHCHAWKKVNGKKVFSTYSEAYPFSVTAITPDQPSVTSVKVSKNTVKVTYTKSANATGYDLVLGKSVKKVNGEMRPVEYGKLVKKVYNGNTVTATFTKVPKGTYYVGLHAYNRTSEDGKKVFSPWSNAKKVVVK